VIYLIRGAIFRPKKSGRVIQNICPLGELINIYHTHKTTLRHDKVYALLGMGSDDLREANLSPDYKVPWKNLFETLTRFLLCKEIFVEASPDKDEEIAVIKYEGCILGNVSSVQSDTGRNGGQDVDVISRNISGTSKEWSSHWTLQPSAKSIRIGDVICLLQGASKPTIIRFYKNYLAIIMIAATPPQTIRTGSEDIEWSNFLQLAKLLRTRDLQVIWDWKNSPEKSRGLGEYVESDDSLDKITRSWNSALVLGDIGKYEKAEEKFREALQGYEIAVRKGRLHDRVAHQLSLADLDLMNSQYRRPPLSWAAEGGHEAVVELLLRTGEADVNPKDMDGRSPLSWAAEEGHEAVVELLLRTGEADVDLKDNDGWSPLSWAAKDGHLAVVERLLQEKAEVNAVAARYEGRTVLQIAAGGGHLAVVERLLQEKAEVNIAAAEFEGKTALQAAAERGHLAVVERLLQEKAEVNAAAAKRYGRTALQAAAEGGHLAIVERLLQEKAEVNIAATGGRGRTALQAAAGGGHLAIVKRLLQEKAEVNAAAAKYYGRTVLQAAAEGGHLAVVERLLQEKAEVNKAAGDYGKTALEAAAEGGHLAVVTRLLQEKAEDSREIALEAAAERGHLAVVERLLQEKIEVNTAAEDSREMALQAAAGRGHLGVVERLRQAGAV
jgi:ankyrin repeat protein